MSQLSDWKRFAVVQRRPATGCIPTGYEMLVRAARLSGVDLLSFQDDFDLDQELGPGVLPKNNFESVAAAVRAKYPQIHIRRYVFEKGRGAEKLAFIEACLAEGSPVLVSLSLVDEGRLTGWHIMLAIGDTADELKLWHHMKNDVDGVGWCPAAGRSDRGDDG